MRALSLTLAVALLLLLPSGIVAEGPDNAKLEELWKTGSLWQVGDNIPKVEAARKEIVAAGDAGLAFIFTKLNSTDGLEYRCLEAVFKGFGAKALPGLFERLAHEDVKVRRNVAAMLGVIDDKSAAPKMVEHLKKEGDLRCKVGHLQTLARWKEPSALDALIECTRVTQEQEPLAERLKVRIVPLLANYSEEKALDRLSELLDDDAYFIRDAARDALRLTDFGKQRAYHDAKRILDAKDWSDRAVSRVRLLLPLVVRADLVDIGKIVNLIYDAIYSDSPELRGDAYVAFADWLKNIAPKRQAEIDIVGEHRNGGRLPPPWKKEKGQDPYLRQRIEEAERIYPNEVME